MFRESPKTSGKLIGAGKYLIDTHIGKVLAGTFSISRTYQALGSLSRQPQRRLFVSQSDYRIDAHRPNGRQQAGEECAESEERRGCEQTACGKGALHPVGEDGAEKAVNGETDDNARGRADERDARGDPQDVRARCTERQADAELCSALRDAVS